LATVARALVAPGKGILAADESLPTIGRRFAAHGILNDAEHRRAYRELLFTTSSLNEFISGAILFDETLRQTSGDVPLPELLTRLGIIPGIKVDAGTVPLANFPDEKITEGLDGLRDRLAAYHALGARFTKWRAVFSVDGTRPSSACVAINAGALARFAALSQETGLVPIVEPEILMDGDHSLARTAELTEHILERVFDALKEHRVELEGMLLKPAMVLPGASSPEQATAAAIAVATLRSLARGVPAAVPGIVFLSGGQDAVVATERLNAICRPGGAPWPSRPRSPLDQRKPEPRSCPPPQPHCCQQPPSRSYRPPLPHWCQLQPTRSCRPSQPHWCQSPQPHHC
jgi:fructose-bisphosphate aldolase class I